MKQHRSILAAIFASVAIHASPAVAGDDHHHDGAPHEHVSAHGGTVVESGHHHLEIVAKDGEIAVYVAGEDGKPEDVSGAKANAAVLSGGKKVDVALAPDAGGFLKGTGDFTATAGTTIVITLTMPEHAPEQARLKLE
ncbi:MAG: hypothetical protein NW216_09195 [Hyphomicrobium sp.]|nr:hypothetical protein [Hyphomicrobium sp.]